jgi:hypothetical protein
MVWYGGISRRVMGCDEMWSKVVCYSGMWLSMASREWQDVVRFVGVWWDVVGYCEV